MARSCRLHLYSDQKRKRALLPSHAWERVVTRDGRVKTFFASHLHSLSKPIALHRIHITFASHFSHFFSFSSLFHGYNAPKSCEKCEISVKNVNMCKMRMQCEKGIKIRIGLLWQKNSFIFAFFALIYITLPVLVVTITMQAHPACTLNGIAFSLL
jgi:hypothetical protein